jgi:hypothetical protein
VTLTPYTCSVEGCGRPYHAKGLCGLHYGRVFRGRPIGPPDVVTYPTVCVVEGCGKPRTGSRGMCWKHYARWQKWGDPLVVKRAWKTNTLAELMTFVEVNPATGCWEWQRSLATHGYGYAGHVGAHRVFYEKAIGPIPEGLVIDHLCRNRGCVNPDHLEPVTVGENNRRGFGASGINARKTHCVRGHDLTDPGNIYTPPGGGRECRACRRIREARRQP